MVKAALTAKLQEIQKVKEDLLKEAKDETENGTGTAVFPQASGLSDDCLVKFADGKEIKVIVGTSEHIQQPLVDRICHVVHEAYSKVGKHKRVDRYDAVDRLEMGDGGPSANRVLHLAFKGDELVGCASSTFSPGWTPEGCGHWGLLAVDPAHQKSGVATALVLAAERRLATLSGAIQIEYQYTEGDPFSMRLHKWYEKLGFAGDQTALKPGQTIFRRCRKRISAAEQERGQLRRLQEIEIYLQRRLTTLSSEHEDQSPEEVEHEQSSAESDEPMEESTVSARLAEVEAARQGAQCEARGGYPVRAA